MELQLVVFNLAGEDYGVPVDQVREINRFADITRIPKAPRFVLGVINLRGHVIPVISLRQKFGFPERQPDALTRIIVSDMAGQTVGFAVDSVTEVLRLPKGSVEPAPESTATVDSAFIQGIGKLEGRMVIVLDLERVFTPDTLAQAAQN